MSELAPSILNIQRHPQAMSQQGSLPDEVNSEEIMLERIGVSI